MDWLNRCWCRVTLSTGLKSSHSVCKAVKTLCVVISATVCMLVNFPILYQESSVCYSLAFVTDSSKKIFELLFKKPVGVNAIYKCSCSIKYNAKKILHLHNDKKYEGKKWNTLLTTKNYYIKPWFYFQRFYFPSDFQRHCMTPIIARNL